MTRWFIGAFLTLGSVDSLVVVVPYAILTDAFESELHVIGFYARYQRPILLVAQNHRGIPTYYGPADLVRIIARLPFESIPYERHVYPSDVAREQIAWIDRVGQFARVDP